MTEPAGPIVSQQLHEIAEVIGDRAALRLADVYGGQEGCYVPIKPKREHPWAQVIGWEAFVLLCETYGGERIDIPRNAAAYSVKARVGRLKSAGLSHRQIAARLRCTERYVRMVLNAGDDRQTDLFSS